MSNESRRARVERVLEWYEKEGIELVGEEELPSLSIQDLQILFGEQSEDPLFYNKYEVEPQHIAHLQRLAKTRINLEKYAYLVACYATE